MLRFNYAKLLILVMSGLNFSEPGFLINNLIQNICSSTSYYRIYFDAGKALDIYPNPPSDNIYIEATVDLRFKANLYSLESELLHSVKNSNQVGAKTIADGTYLLVIQDLNSNSKGSGKGYFKKTKIIDSPFHADQRKHLLTLNDIHSYLIDLSNVVEMKKI